MLRGPASMLMAVNRTPVSSSGLPCDRRLVCVPVTLTYSHPCDPRRATSANRQAYTVKNCVGVLLVPVSTSTYAAAPPAIHEP